jgi:membrane protein DedA with SNARE-associated domain
MSIRQASTIDPVPTPDRPQTTTAWRRFVPWQGPATRTDMALMGAILGVVALGLVLRPLKPFLLASHPVTLEFLTGDLTAIGAAAAFARIGEAPLWLVVVAGAAGMVKLDWLTWWTGRQWGGGIIKMFTSSQRAQRFANRATEMDPKILRAAVVLAVLPGVPTAVIYAMAGWARMRLTTFLLLDLAGAFLMTGLVAGVGYGLGQHAVDLVLLVDRFASVVSLTLIAVAAVMPLVKRRIRRKGVAQQHAPPSANETDLAVPAAGRDLPLVDD